MNGMNVPQKLGFNKYELDEGHPHIEVHQEVCRAKCPGLTCLMVCPAEVYRDVNGVIVADWAGCLECGTCQVSCPTEALHWVYPRGGFGIVYREG